MTYSKKTEESYDIIKSLLSLISCNEFQWEAGGDLKVIRLLTGMQKGYTKYCCCLYPWDSRARDEYNIWQDWLARHAWTPGSSNVEHLPLVPPELIVSPTLHTKVGTFKSFVMSVDYEEEPIKLS